MRMLYLALILVTSAAQAEDYVKFSQVKDFLAKKRRCHFAVGLVHKASPAIQCRGDKDCVAETIWCFEDVVEGAGGISEQKGCALTDYSLKNHRYTPMPRSISTVGTTVYSYTSKKDCAKGGFEEILKKPMAYGPRQGSLVAETIKHTPKKFGIENARVEVLYSADPAALETWSK